ncbi:hypothetical protein ALC56_05232, partial [Trachymyrmex septentrionalis]
DATRRDAAHRVDSVGTERRAGIVYCASSINPPPSPISSRTHPASPGLIQSANMSQGEKLCYEANVVRPRGVERLSVKSRHRAVSAKRDRVCFTNRGRVLAKNKRLNKRRGTTVREGDAIRATRRSRKHTGRVAQESRRRKKERDVEKEGRQVRQHERRRKTTDCKRTKKNGRGRKRGGRGGGLVRAVYKERVQTRQLRTRPKTAIKSRDKQTTNPFCRPPEEAPATIVLTIVGTPSRDFSAGTEDEESSHLLPSSLPAIAAPPLCPFFIPRARLSQPTRSRVRERFLCRDSPCL